MHYSSPMNSARGAGKKKKEKKMADADAWAKNVIQT